MYTVNDTINTFMNITPDKLDNFKYSYGGIFLNEELHLWISHKTAAMGYHDYDKGYPIHYESTAISVDELYRQDKLTEATILEHICDTLLQQEFVKTCNTYPNCMVAICDNCIVCHSA